MCTWSGKLETVAVAVAWWAWVRTRLRVQVLHGAIRPAVGAVCRYFVYLHGPHGPLAFLQIQVQVLGLIFAIFIQRKVLGSHVIFTVLVCRTHIASDGPSSLAHNGVGPTLRRSSAGTHSRLIRSEISLSSLHIASSSRRRSKLPHSLHDVWHTVLAPHAAGSPR